MNRKRELLAEGALLLTGMIFGSMFVVIKGALDSIGVNWLTGIRFLFAAVILFAAAGRRVRCDKRAIQTGAACGFLLFISTFFQMYGLSRTTAGNAAFLTTVYVVEVPFILWALYRERPTRLQVGTACLTLLGVGFITLSEGLRLGLGDAIVLFASVLCAGQVVAVNVSTGKKGVPALTLSCWQFLFTGLFALAAAVLFDPPFPLGVVLGSPDTLWALLYTGVVCSLLAFVLQNVGVKYAPVSISTLLLATEAPFGCLFGVLLLGEALSPQTGVGFALVVLAIVLSETLKKNRIHNESYQ